MTNQFGVYEVIGVMPTLNEYIDLERRNKFAGAAMKKKYTKLVADQLAGQQAIDKPCTVTFYWHISSNADFDNIRFAAKFILDGMKAAKIIVDDRQKYIIGFEGDFFTKVPKGQEKIIIHLEDYTNE